ncbi:MAG: hypothetical protein U0S48_16510 [Solirubrobacteraceae bacterium]
MIRSPHNDKLKTLRRLARRRDGRFVAEGEICWPPRDDAGWEALERYAAAGSGLPGTEVEPAVLATVSALGSGTRALAVYRERWAGAAAGRAASRCGACATPATSARSCARRWHSAPRSSPSGPAPPIRTAPRRARSMGALFALLRRPGGAGRAAVTAERIAWSRKGEPLQVAVAAASPSRPAAQREPSPPTAAITPVACRAAGAG